jgi:hypothetical protein
MDKQAIFDKVTTHLLEQGRPAMNEHGCAYRGEDGTKCAIGCLIPDDLYMPAFEEKSVNLILRKFDVDKKLSAALGITPYNPNDPYNQSDLKFLERLQLAHDAAQEESSPAAIKSIWSSRFKIIAEDYGLKFTYV